MKVSFTQKDRDQILKSIQGAMGDRKLGDMVSFDLAPGQLLVTIAKLGKSVLTFEEKSHEQGLTYTLVSEKIALAHRAFKDDVTSKIVKVIELAGGKVVA